MPCSIPEPFPTASSPDGLHRVFPYTMDYGLPQRCDLGTGQWGAAGLGGQLVFEAMLADSSRRRHGLDGKGGD